MKSIYLALTLFLLLPYSVNAKASLLSPIPLPYQEVINLSTETCDTSCLEQLAKNEQIFSYLALFDTQAQENSQLLQIFDAYCELAGIDHSPLLETPSETTFNVALLFARKIIGSYSSNVTNTILSYLLTQQKSFNFEAFDSVNESATQLQQTLDKIQSKGYHYIIAILTNSGAKVLTTLDYHIPTYIASISKSQIVQDNSFLEKAHIPTHIVFGGIDYEEQVRLLSQFNTQTTAISFNDDGFVGSRLASWVKKYNHTNTNAVIYEETFNEQKAKDFPKNIRPLINTIRHSRVFLNTPPTNSAMILSQITYNHITTTNGIYSTQLNYTPLLFSLTQPNDRKNLIIANSIQPLADNLIEYASLLNSDLTYDWINYSSALGIEYFYLQTFPQATKYYAQSIQNGSVSYTTRLYRADDNHFIPISE